MEENLTQMPTPQLALKDTEEVKCTCGSTLFRQLVSLRKVSALYTGTGRSEYVPVPTLVCDKCNTVFERPKLEG